MLRSLPLPMSSRGSHGSANDVGDAVSMVVRIRSGTHTTTTVGVQSGGAGAQAASAAERMHDSIAALQEQLDAAKQAEEQEHQQAAPAEETATGTQPPKQPKQPKLQTAQQRTQAQRQKQQQKGEAGQRQRPKRAAEPSPYEVAVAQCRDLACLTAAGKLPMSPGQFRFPSFFVVGWQKCATTALFGNLINHPAVLSAVIKVRCTA